MNEKRISCLKLNTITIKENVGKLFYVQKFELNAIPTQLFNLVLLQL